MSALSSASRTRARSLGRALGVAERLVAAVQIVRHDAVGQPAQRFADEGFGARRGRRLGARGLDPVLRKMSVAERNAHA